MTFDEWWGKTEKDEEIKNREVIYKNLAKLLAHDAWRTAQKEQFLSDIEASPKWTLCKDRLPKEKDGKVITTHETDASFYSHEIKVIRVYVKLETQNPFNETRIDNFCLSTNKFEKYEDLVIAWMPLPEAPDNIDK